MTNSLFSPWDAQFYPDMEKKGGYILQACFSPFGRPVDGDCDIELPKGTLRKHATQKSMQPQYLPQRTFTH